MTRSCRGPLVVAALLGLWALAAVPARAQPKKPDPVKVTTVDGVELHGAYYASAKNQAPVVICLHNIGTGESGMSKNWVSLAETLQPNFNVLLFDFRGHGKSKNIEPDMFWSAKNPDNAKFVKGAPKKDVIDVADFNRSYYPFLANDLSAVKAYLDRKNDAGACNSASTILIGAEQGATLGAVWLNSEWHRFKMISNPMFPAQMKPAADPEGKDVIACIWLTISPKLGAIDVPLKHTLDIPVRQKAMATVFMYGDGDKSGKDFAVTMEKALKEKGSKKHEMVVSYPCEKTNLKGVKLVVKSLGTDGVINEFLSKNVLPTRGNEYSEREWRKTNFAWLVGANPLPAREKDYDGMNLKYFSYYPFIGR